jgi:hypothetical protein
MCASTETDVRECASDCTLASEEGLGSRGETLHPICAASLCPHPLNTLYKVSLFFKSESSQMTIHKQNRKLQLITSQQQLAECIE